MKQSSSFSARHLLRIVSTFTQVFLNPIHMYSWFPIEFSLFSFVVDSVCYRTELFRIHRNRFWTSSTNENGHKTIGYGKCVELKHSTDTVRNARIVCLCVACQVFSLNIHQNVPFFFVSKVEKCRQRLHCIGLQDNAIQSANKIDGTLRFVMGVESCIVCNAYNRSNWSVYCIDLVSVSWLGSFVLIAVRFIPSMWCALNEIAFRRNASKSFNSPNAQTLNGWFEFCASKLSDLLDCSINAA